VGFFRTINTTNAGYPVPIVLGDSGPLAFPTVLVKLVPSRRNSQEVQSHYLTGPPRHHYSAVTHSSI